MLSQEAKVEQWFDAASDSVWERNPETKVFSLALFHGKEIDTRWSSLDISKALNCGLSSSTEDGAKKSQSVAFPPGFRYSPNTGKLLSKPSTKIHTWLPVSGSENLKSGLVRGGCLTSHSFKLKGDACVTQDPDLELPLPGRGLYRFCCGAFGLLSTFLLALDARQGIIHCWLPSLREWTELKPIGQSLYLGTETLSPEIWSIEAQEIGGDTVLFWPSDIGLIAIKVDALSLSYEARLMVEGSCLTVPRILRNKLYVFIKDERSARAVSVDAAWQSEYRPVNLPLNDIPISKWEVAAATPREIIWLSDMGQVVLRPDAQQYAFIPWEAGIEPKFILGGPHCSSDGILWMQVLYSACNHEDSGFYFLELGRSAPIKRASFAARAVAGHSSFKVEQRCKEDPWVEPKVVSSEVHRNNEAVIPILESISDGTILVLRADHIQGIFRFFDRTDEIITTRFQIIGQHGDAGFYMKRLRKPWATSAFLFDGALFLYHPDMELLPGWLIYSPDNQ